MLRHRGVRLCYCVGWPPVLPAPLHRMVGFADRQRLDVVMFVFGANVKQPASGALHAVL